MKKIRMMMAAALGVLVSCGSVKPGERGRCGFPQFEGCGCLCYFVE